MMKYWKLYLVGIVICFFGSCKQEGPYRWVLNLHEITQVNNDLNMVRNQKGEEVCLYIPSSDSAYIEINLKKNDVNWEKVNYLVCRVYHENNYSALLYFQFFRQQQSSGEVIVEQGQSGHRNAGQGPRMVSKIGVLPKLSTQVVFPLHHLDGQNIFLHKQPRQLKGTVLGSRIEKNDIEKIRLMLAPYSRPGFIPQIEIDSLFFCSDFPDPLPPVSGPVMDEFGQWTARSWPGKTTALDELRANDQRLREQIRTATFPDSWSRYGGLKALNFGGTGFFRTHHDGKRWWLVDPEGYAFLSTGVDCIGYNAATLINGNEDLFEWLPQRADSLYYDCFSPNNKGEGTLFNFFMANRKKMDGPHWKKKWSSGTRDLLITCRFNTVANWSDLEFAKNAHLPYVLPLRNFPTTEVLLFRDFPDVFAQEYAQKAAVYAQQLDEYQDDPWLIGYFLANEPKWAFGSFNLAFEMFTTNQKSETRSACINFLRDQYNGAIDRFNQDWAMNLRDFDDLMSITLKEESVLTDRAIRDLKAFSEIMVKRYIKVVCDAVKKVDSNHLNLGLRYAWISSDLCYIAGEFFDVFSINGYSFPGPPETRNIFQRSNKPIMIGEFHFGSIDRGLPATGIVGAASQADRARAYRYYLENGFARPEIVGMHYFQWIDQPVLGRSDGENYNIGFIDICGKPYPEMTNAAIRSNERMYEIARGRIAPFDEVVEKMPQIYY